MGCGVSHGPSVLTLPASSKVVRLGSPVRDLRDRLPPPHPFASAGGDSGAFPIFCCNISSCRWSLLPRVAGRTVVAGAEIRTFGSGVNEHGFLSSVQAPGAIK